MKNVSSSISEFAKIQADGIFNSIQILNKNVQLNERYIGELNALNVMSGLCIELYLKSFLRSAKNSAVVKGHNLEKLFSEIPHFLKKLIKQTYLLNFDKDAEFYKISILISENISQTTLLQDKQKLHSFDGAIKILSTVYVDSRYFFEELTDRNWIAVDYYFESVRAICQSLKVVFEQYARGDYGGRIR